MIQIKHIFAAVSVVLCIILSCVPVFADEITDPPLDAEIIEITDDEEKEEDNVTVPDTPATSPSERSDTVITDKVTENTQVNVIIADNGVTGASTEDGSVWMDGGSGESLVEKLFGAYRPYDATGIASVDWAWVADVTLFIVVLVSFFKILGGVIKRV